VRADRAWAAWLVPTLADFVTAQRSADAAGADAAKAWLQGLFAQSPSAAALGRKVARHMRRLSQPSADESSDARPPARRQVPTCKVERAAARKAPVARPSLAARRRAAVARPGGRTTCEISLPCEIWSAGIMEKHLRFQLARPAA
jgi:hypothetical protein